MNAETVSALINIFPWLIPECVLGLFACVLFLGGTWRTNRHLWGAVALGGLFAAGVAQLLTPLPSFQTKEAAWAALFAGPVWLDRMAVLLKMVTILGGGVLVLFSWDEVSDEHAAEYHGCLLTIIAGTCLTTSANDLVTLFLALELISIPTYILLYLVRTDDAGKEAAVKYFLLSVFSSALLLFGFSYLYGLSGTTNLQGIADALSPRDHDEALPGMALVALVMVVAGLGFKITAVPFHFYAPVALIRVLGLMPFELHDRGPGPGPLLASQVSMLLCIVAAVTMTLGNVLALLQDNVKRLPAYSSVAHAGYMLIGLAVALGMKIAESRGLATKVSTGGTDAVLFYLVSYGAMTIGAFAVLEYLSTRDRPVETVDDLTGLSKSHPGVALLMALFMISLIGLPATAGFIGKFLLFVGAFSVPYVPGVETGLGDQANLFRILALIGVLNAAVGAWYYLRIIAVMYLRTPLQPLAKPPISPRLVAVGICAAVTLLFGLYPRPLVDRSQEAVVNKVDVPSGPKAMSNVPD